MPPGLARSLIIDALATALLALYGGEVCPLIEGLGFLRAWGDFAIAFGVAQVAALGLGRALGDRPGDWPANAARIGFYRYFGVGLGLGAFNLMHRGFPLPSAFKVLMGCLTLGVVASQDAKLAAESRLLDAVERGEAAALELGRPASRVTEITALALLGLALFTVDMLLVVRKDLEDLSFLTMEALPDAVDAVGRELVTVGGVLVLSAAHLVTGAGRNLRRLFENQTRVLAEVERGVLDAYVPVASRDEFGLIAQATNRMIDALRERRTLRDVFGKIVSPQIARQLLAHDAGGEGGPLGRGRRRRVAVLFSDIRGFTSMSEDEAPESVVEALNQHFGVLVGVVHRNRGVVDKFLGDGLMAVFGLDEAEGAEARAVAAATEMMAALPALRAALGRDLRLSVGVHAGEVVSGAIGSPDRLEFTVVGDTVNTASRVEALTREVGCDLLITDAVFDALGRPEGWRDLGSRQIRGRRGAVGLYGPP